MRTNFRIVTTVGGKMIFQFTLYATRQKTRNGFETVRKETTFSLAVFSPLCHQIGCSSSQQNHFSCLFLLLFPPSRLKNKNQVLRMSRLLKISQLLVFPLQKHTHTCNYTHCIRRGSPVFHFVEFAKGRLPLRWVYSR